MNRTKNIIALIISTILIVIFSWAFFQSTFFRVHDFTHVARLVEMKRALDAGHFPAIWSQNLGFGYGMPLFLFYGPLPSYLGIVFAALGLNSVWSVKMVFAATGLIGFAGTYIFLKRWGRTSALLGATLLLAAPYRAVDLFVRGALNEVLAIGLLPWILNGLWQIEDNPRRGFIHTSFWTALLVLTHNLTALMALPVLFTLGTVNIILTSKKKLERIGILVASGLTGILLSSFYAIPAFLEKNETSIGEILSGYFDFRLHFLYIRQLVLPRWGFGGSEYGPNDGISFHLGFPLITLLVISVVIILYAWFRQWQRKHYFKPAKRDWIFLTFVLATGATLYLTLTHSQPVWESVSLLSFIQFPWRFIGVAIVLLSSAAGIGLSRLRKGWLRWLITAIALPTILVAQLKFHQPESFLETDDGYYYTDEQRLRTQMSDILPDYIPAGFDRTLTPPQPEERIIIEPEVEGRWELNRPHELLYFADAPSGTITWNIADFPGWEYSVNDQVVEAIKLPDGRRQYITETKIETVGARLASTPLRSWTLLLSLVTWIGWAALALPIRKNNK